MQSTYNYLVEEGFLNPIEAEIQENKALEMVAEYQMQQACTWCARPAASKKYHVTM